MNNGYLTGLAQNGFVDYEGQLRTRRFCVRFRLEPNNKRSERDADFLIMEKSPYHGEMVMIGRVWQNTVKQGQNAGNQIFSLAFQDESFGPDGLRVTGFFEGHVDGRDSYALSLDRKRGSEAAQAEAA